MPWLLSKVKSEADLGFWNKATGHVGRLEWRRPRLRSQWLATVSHRTSCDSLWANGVVWEWRANKARTRKGLHEIGNSPFCQPHGWTACQGHWPSRRLREGVDLGRAVGQEGRFHCIPAKRNLWLSGWHVWLPRRVYSPKLFWLLSTSVIPHCFRGRMTAKGWVFSAFFFSNVNNDYTSQTYCRGMPW